MTDTPRKRGAPKRYGPMRLIQMHVTDDLGDWFEALPGNSNHERMRWLRAMQDERDALRQRLDAMIERYGTGYNASDPEILRARAMIAEPQEGTR